MKAIKAFLAFSFLVFWLTPAFGQGRNTENTLELDDPAKRPAALISDMGWLVGSWEGEGFGGRFEESWSTPTAGSMVSTFKLVHAERPSLYEFQMLVEEEGSLTFKLKHFNSDFSAWEEKDEFVSFPLVKLTADGAWFAGLTYKRIDSDQLEVFVAIGDPGELREERLVFRRAKAGIKKAPEPSPNTQPDAQGRKRESGR